MIRGFDDARVFESVKEIAALRKRHPEIAILHGLEVDILADGTLDLGDEALAALDWVIVSLHMRLQQPAAEMTPRVLKALDHPAVCVMGHPTARRIGQREAAAFDLDAVLARAAARGVAMEINAHPQRTDLNGVNARLAKARGVSLVISTDAHRTAELDFLRYGVFAARRAGLTREDVLNTLPFERFEERLRHHRAPAAKSAPAAPAKTAPKAAAKPARAARASAVRPKTKPAVKPAAKRPRKP
jgi:DNA polymerase (family 10)